MSSGKESVELSENTAKSVGTDGGGVPPGKSWHPPWPPVHKKLAPPLICCREGNKANLPLPLDVQKLKAFQLQGASPPDPWSWGQGASAPEAA